MSSTAPNHFSTIASIYEKGTGGTTRRVAAHLAKLASPIQPNANILDNACGPGVVVDEILARVTADEEAHRASPVTSNQESSSTLTPSSISSSTSILASKSIIPTLHFTALDASPPMIDIVTHKSQTTWSSTHHLPPTDITALPLAAENLDSIPSDTFDHSFTNFGILFFNDPIKGATHIYRTLKPGGMAYITSWKDLGYTNVITRAAGNVRPDGVPPPLPFDTIWFESDHLRSVLEQAGFKKGDIEIREQESAYIAASIGGLAEQLAGMMSGVLKGRDGWSDGEIERLKGKLEGELEVMARRKDGALVVEGDEARIRMVAHVAVARK